MEIRNDFDEIVVAVDGDAVVRTGGKLAEVGTIASGELRGKSAEGGSPAMLREHAVVTIPAGTPHEVVVPDRGYVTYIDVKIEHRASSVNRGREPQNGGR